MKKITLKIDGMACSMCEAHINDCIRQNFSVKKVTSSHSKGETVIIVDTEPDKEKLQKAITDTGYTLKDIKSEDYEGKGGLFSLFKKKK